MLFYLQYSKKTQFGVRLQMIQFGLKRYNIASELAKRDGQLPLQCNISCPRRMAIS
jgi:hypothetical protein